MLDVDILLFIVNAFVGAHCLQNDEIDDKLAIDRTNLTFQIIDEEI